MKLVTCVVVCLALGTIGGFALGYVLLAKPAVAALDAQRKQNAELEATSEAELKVEKQAHARYKAAVDKRDGELRERLQHFAGRTSEIEFLNPEAVGAAFSWFATELDRPITPAPQTQ